MTAIEQPLSLPSSKNIASRSSFGKIPSRLPVPSWTEVEEFPIFAVLYRIREGNDHKSYVPRGLDSIPMLRSLIWDLLRYDDSESLRNKADFSVTFDVGDGYFAEITRIEKQEYKSTFFPSKWSTFSSQRFCKLFNSIFRFRSKNVDIAPEQWNDFSDQLTQKIIETAYLTFNKPLNIQVVRYSKA